MVKQIKKIYWFFVDLIYYIARKRELIFLILFFELLILISILLKVNKIYKSIIGG